MIDFLDERDNLNAGRPGTAGQRWANLAQQNCDFILCLGSRLDIGQTAYRLDNFAPNASKYICEIDEMEIRKLPKSFKSFHAPLNNFLFELHALLEKHYQTRNQGLGWTNKIQLLKEKFPLIPSHKVTMKNGVNLYHFIEELSNTMDPNDILVPGSSGACSEVVMQAFKVKDGQRILNSEGLGPMGFGLPAAIGVAFANDKKNRIISIDGDGGFLMNIQELVTLKYHNLPIVIFVLNNSGYGSIRSTQISYFDGRLMGTDPTSGLGLPNWNSLIEGFGLNHFYIQDYKSMKEILFNLKRISLPCVIEVLIEKNQITEPRVASTRLLSGEFKTDDMANMSPKLTLTEFENLKSFLVD
jgi:acetolactate synthase-1/2/3 large subunit